MGAKHGLFVGAERAASPTRWAPALLALTLGAGCGGTEEAYFGTTSRSSAFETTTFHVNNGNEPEYLDPGMAHDTASSALIHQMFEGLTAFGYGDMHPVQAGAIRYEKSADNRYFRFHLRPDAKWSDGKPVTAHDYAYAWRRVLRPITASQAATTIYSIKNAELFNQKKLLVTKAATVLLDSPAATSSGATTLPEGTAVQIVAEGPKVVLTGFAPLAAPAAGRGVEFDKKAGTLAVAGGKAEGASGGLKDATVLVLDRGPSVECNGDPDHWFLVEKDGQKGYLPGCALGKAKGAELYALVERFDEWPTFAPILAPTPPPAPESAPGDAPKDAPSDAPGGTPDAPAVEAKKPALPRGFVKLSALTEDDRVLGIHVADDLTLEVELERPTAYFLDITSTTMLFPVRHDVVEPFVAKGEPDMWTRPENIVSNGPFMLSDHKFRYELRLTRNPHHPDHDKLRFHEIVVSEVESYNATMNLYKSGDLDYLGDNSSLPTEYVKYLFQKEDFVRYLYASTYWYELNTKKPPLDDVRVRRALNLGIDKKTLVEYVTKGGQVPASHYVPEIIGLGYDEAVKEAKKAGTDVFEKPEYTFNPTLGRKLLGEAGFPVSEVNGQLTAKDFPPIEILYNTAEAHRNIALAVQDMWKKNLGITVTLRNEEWKVMLKNVRDGNFQVVRFGWVAEYNHAQTYMDTFMSFSPSNRTGWGSQEFDDAVKVAASTADPKASIQLYRDAERMAVDAMPKIPLYFYTKQTLIKPWVLGFTPNAKNLQLFKWLSIDPNQQTMPAKPQSPAFADVEFEPPGTIAPIPMPEKRGPLPEKRPW